MASGFQQNTNQLAPSFYRVVIDTSGYPTADGNDNGGITPNSSDSFSSANLPTTLIAGKARSRGNMRFRNIVNRLSGLADCQILDIEINEANGNAQATSVAFTVKFDRSAGILDAVKAAIGSPFTGYDGATAITTTVLALKDQIARGVGDATTANVRVFNGSLRTDNQMSLTVASPGAAADLWDDVVVNLIDGTELETSDNVAPAE